MKINILPSYKEIFYEEPIALNELLVDIPSILLISLLSGISARLSMKDDLDTQIEIYHLFIARIPEKEKKEIFNGIFPFIKLNKGNLKLFSIWICTEFIERELLSFRETDISELTPTHELRIFKAYILIGDQLVNKATSLNPQTNFGLATLIWPKLVKQFEFNIRVDPMYQSVKSLLLFNQLEKSNEIRPYVTKWIGSFNRPSHWNYILDLMNLCSIRFIKENNNANIKFNPFVIESSLEFESIFEDLVIDVSQFSALKTLSNDYIRIREKPLLRSFGKYIVLNWDFLFNKLYSSLLFSFYKNSGISEKYKKFVDFKSYVGTNFSEKILLRRIFISCFKRDHIVLSFDDDQTGIPDCYYRNGNKLFIFEFKDALISSAVIQNQSFEEIKNDIDIRFVKNASNKPKGVLQLVEHLKKIDSGQFHFDNLSINTRIKRRNIRIYPIIVYTHPIHSMSGINDYLNGRFKESLDKVDFNQIDSKNIKPLTLIDLEYFFRTLIVFHEKGIKLENKIDSYHSICKTKMMKIKKNANIERYVDLLPSFVEINLPKVHHVAKRGDFIEKTFELLGVTEDLPK